ncbi:MAG: hypothetical protein HFJ99_05715 [Eubacterium sp.]|jgi:uncharacterized membrane protein HdeD (DUF308 family)|nr:hypothetical protein [Eubacterium sp.]
MRKILTEIKKYSLIVIVITGVLGGLLVAFPDKMLAYTALFIGGAFAACGVFAILNYLSDKKSKLTLTLGIIAAFSGIVICLAYRQIMSVIVFFLGIFLLIGGIVDLVNSFYIAASRHRSWILTVILSIASIVLGIVSITNPFDTQNKIVQFIGAGLIVFAVLDLIAFIQVKKVAEEVSQRISDTKDEYGATEVEYREVDDN